MSVTITSQTPFSIHAAAYWIARRSYEEHRDQCQAPLTDSDPLQSDYDSAYTPLVTAMHHAAVAAVETPASTTAEIFKKIEIFLNESLHEDNHETVRSLIEALGRDAAKIGGAA